jgi:hypothetical protein
MSTQSSQSKYQEVNKRRTKKLRDTRRKFEIQRERAETSDEEKLRRRRGEASAAIRGARAAERSYRESVSIWNIETSGLLS